MQAHRISSTEPVASTEEGSDRSVVPQHRPAATPLHSLAFSHAAAFVLDGVRWTTDRLVHEAGRLAAGMVAAGVRPGERVCLHLPNGPEIALAYHACFQIGAVAVPMNLRYTTIELESVVRRVQPVLYVGHSNLFDRFDAIDADLLPASARYVAGPFTRERARPFADLFAQLPGGQHPARLDVNAPAVLLATSGTTGQPKFVAHSLSTLMHITQRAEHLGFRPSQTVVLVLPMVHVSGLSTFLAVMHLGGTLVFADARNPDAILDTIQGYRCTLLAVLPMTITQLITCQQQKPRDVSSLTWCVTSGDACPATQQEAFLSVFGQQLHSFWSSTEAVTSLTFSHHDSAAGRLAPGAEMRLVDSEGAEVQVGRTGEMMLRGPNVMLGYWIGPGRLEGLQDGWYRTGDLMQQDDDGDLWFVSRLHDLIVRGGSNISPVEVEQALSAHPAVREVAVIGVPDPLLGQKVIGMVRLQDGQDASQLAAILKSASSRLAAYKLPEELLPVAEMPRNGLGKIDRKLLAARMVATACKTDA